MFFSIIVPVYNVKPYLRKCLESLVNQTCKDREIIIIDDGSTDGSGEICDEYDQKYSDIIVIHQKNQGSSKARNTGLSIAKGEWIVFVDDDDWVSTDMLELLQGYIIATSADMYCMGFEFVNYKGLKIAERRITKKNTIASFNNEQEQFIFYFREHYSFQRLYNCIYRRDIIQKHRLSIIDTNKVFSEDTLFNYCYFLHIHKVVLLSDRLYYYRKRKGSLSSTTSAKEQIQRCATLGEYAYRAVLAQGLTYFKQNFFKHYFLFLNVYSLSYKKTLSDKQLRIILNEMWGKRLHRTCIKKIRQESDYFKKYTMNRVWYDENFGLQM